MKTKKVLTSLLVLAIVAGTLLVFEGSGCAPKPVEKVFKFGNAAPFSGPYAPWGWMLQPSLEIAAEDINAAGGIKVGGDYYQVEVVRYDNQMDPTVSTTITRKAIYDDGIKYISVISTDEAAAVNELINTEKVVLFSLAPYRDYIGPEFPYSFQTYYEIIEGEDVILDYVLKAYPEYKRIAVMAPDDVRGHISGADFLASPSLDPFTVVDVIYSEAGTTDYYSVLTTLLAKGVDIIDISCTGGSDQGHIIKQARELGFEGLFIHPDTIDVPTVASIAGIEALEGNLAASQLVEMPTDSGKSWAERYTARYGSLQYWTSYGGYDVLWLLKAAIEKANTFDTEKVIDALGTVTFDGLSGTTSLSANKFSGGLPRALKVKMYVIQIQNGQEVDVYSGYGKIWQ